MNEIKNKINHKYHYFSGVVRRRSFCIMRRRNRKLQYGIVWFCFVWALFDDIVDIYTLKRRTTMQIAIEIDEDYYEDCKKWRKRGIADDLETVIANGTPLPKGHGRLIDADVFCDSIRASCNTGYDTFDCETICDAINEIDAILEADKEE